MEIKRLRQFRTIVEAGGLVKAAGLLHLTAGALSKSMQDLEAELGKTLFSRVGRALSPTVDGHRLYRESHRLIEEHQRLLKSLDTTAPSQPATLRIASFEVFTTHVLAQMVEHTLTAYALHVIELSVQDIGPAVLRGESDYGITYAPFPHKGLDFKAVGTSRFGVFARTGVFKRTAFAEIPFAIPVCCYRSQSLAVLVSPSAPPSPFSGLASSQVVLSSHRPECLAPWMPPWKMMAFCPDCPSALLALSLRQQQPKRTPFQPRRRSIIVG